MKVKLVYRNYKPLHMVYESLVKNPPDGVEFIVPPVKTQFKKFYKYYKTLRFFPPTRFLIRLAEQRLFAAKSDDGADLYHYINMISERPLQKPYIVDTEHAGGLVSFTPDENRIKNVSKFLQNENCKAIGCWSEAAKRTLQNLLGADYGLVANKVHVVYPAIPQVSASLKPDHSLIKQSEKLKVLFVGNQAYLKGLDELLAAAKNINKTYSANRIELHVVTDDGEEIVKKYNLPNVTTYLPRFAKEEIITKLFLPADVFVMPTKEDTFGLALLDAQACGTPVITTAQFATPELVKDGEDGMLLKLDNPVLDAVLVPGRADMASVTQPNFNASLARQIESALSAIIEGAVDLEQMGGNGLQKFKPGQKFAIDTRNKILKEIYESALQ